MRQVRGWMVGWCCAVRRAARGEETPDARLREAQTAFDEANTLWDAGRYADAIARGEQALALREAVLGGTHPDVARSLDLLGLHHLLQGKPVRAEPLLRRALAIQEAALGQNHPEVAQNAHPPRQPLRGPGVVRPGRAALCACAGHSGSGPRQEPSPRRRVAPPPRQPLLGPGLYARAEPLYVRALAIREAALGKDHPEVAQTLNDLAWLYEPAGVVRPGRAAPLTRGGHSGSGPRQGPSPRRRLALPNSPSSTVPGVVRSCRAALLARAGHSGSGPRQEPSRRRRLALATRLPLRDHGVQRSCRAALLRARWPFGKRPSARTIPSSPTRSAGSASSTSSRGCMAGPSHSSSAWWPSGKRPWARTIPSSPTCSSTSAASTWPRGCTLVPSPSSSARWPFGKRPSARTAVSSPPRSSTSATSTWPRGCTRRAEPLLQRGLAIREAALGENHPFVAKTLSLLGNLYVAQGLYARAEPLCGARWPFWKRPRQGPCPRRHPAQGPRRPLLGPGVVRPGQAALRARARHSRKRLSARTIPASLKCSTSWAWSIWPSIASPRPCRCSRAPSPCPSSACARSRSASPRRAWPASSSSCAPTRNGSTRCCAPTRTTPASGAWPSAPRSSSRAAPSGRAPTSPAPSTGA